MHGYRSLTDRCLYTCIIDVSQLSHWLRNRDVNMSVYNPDVGVVLNIMLVICTEGSWEVLSKQSLEITFFHTRHLSTKTNYYVRTVRSSDAPP